MREEHTSERSAMDSVGSRCKIVVVGDAQCGKTALLHVFAKDCYPEVKTKRAVQLHSVTSAGSTCHRVYCLNFIGWLDFYVSGVSAAIKL